jgi:hypothetical protein
MTPALSFARGKTARGHKSNPISKFISLWLTEKLARHSTNLRRRVLKKSSKHPKNL